MDSCLLSSDNQCWQTPENILELVRAVAPIALDPFTTAQNPTKARFYGALDHSLPDFRDGYKLPWAALTKLGGGQFFTNPEYGDNLGDFAEKCCLEASCRAHGIALVPSRTDTVWWNALADFCDALLFWKGRIKFIDPSTGMPRKTLNKKSGKWVETPAPFPCCLFYFGDNAARFKEVFGDRGRIF